MKQSTFTSLPRKEYTHRVGALFRLCVVDAISTKLAYVVSSGARYPRGVGVLSASQGMLVRKLTGILAQPRVVGCATTKRQLADYFKSGATRLRGHAMVFSSGALTPAKALRFRSIFGFTRQLVNTTKIAYSWDTDANGRWKNDERVLVQANVAYRRLRRLRSRKWLSFVARNQAFPLDHDAPGRMLKLSRQLYQAKRYSVLSWWSRAAGVPAFIRNFATRMAADSNLSPAYISFLVRTVKYRNQTSWSPLNGMSNTYRKTLFFKPVTRLPRTAPRFAPFFSHRNVKQRRHHRPTQFTFGFPLERLRYRWRTFPKYWKKTRKAVKLKSQRNEWIMRFAGSNFRENTGKNALATGRTFDGSLAYTRLNIAGSAVPFDFYKQRSRVTATWKLFLYRKLAKYRRHMRRYYTRVWVRSRDVPGYLKTPVIFRPRRKKGSLLGQKMMRGSIHWSRSLVLDKSSASAAAIKKPHRYIYDKMAREQSILQRGPVPAVQNTLKPSPVAEELIHATRAQIRDDRYRGFAVYMKGRRYRKYPTKRLGTSGRIKIKITDEAFFAGMLARLIKLRRHRPTKLFSFQGAPRVFSRYKQLFKLRRLLKRDRVTQLHTRRIVSKVKQKWAMSFGARSAGLFDTSSVTSLIRSVVGSRSDRLRGVSSYFVRKSYKECGFGLQQQNTREHKLRCVWRRAIRVVLSQSRDLPLERLLAAGFAFDHSFKTPYLKQFSQRATMSLLQKMHTKYYHRSFGNRVDRATPCRRLYTYHLRNRRHSVWQPIKPIFRRRLGFIDKFFAFVLASGGVLKENTPTEDLGRSFNVRLGPNN